MSFSRTLTTLTAFSGLILLGALALAAGGLPHASGAWPSFSLPKLPGFANADMASVATTPTFISGLVAGWLLRWLYALPWGSIPRAIADWLLSWRQSVTWMALAIGCTAVLLLF